MARTEAPRPDGAVALPGHGSCYVCGNDNPAGLGVTFYLKDGVVVGANAVNSAKDIRFARKWIAEKRRVDPVALADPAVPLKQLDAS